MSQPGGNPKLTNPRAIALQVLQKTRKGQHVQASLAESLSQSQLSVPDRQLCVDLVYGILRLQLRIDYIIHKFLANPAKLPPQFTDHLALGIYALLAQDHVPTYAAINETVKLVKKKFGQKLASVANGVLRNVERTREDLANPSWYASDKSSHAQWAAQCVFYGMPLKIANLWKDAWDERTAIALMQRSAARPWTGLRVNRSHPLACAAMAELGNSPNGVACGAGGFAFAPGHAPIKLLDKSLDYWRNAGLLDYQAPGSMLIMEKLALREWKKPVWDCCAGVGGKTAWLLENGVPVTLASDTSLKRLGNSGAQYGRPGLQKPYLLAADACNPPLECWDGHILVDAPCSGLGVLARRPDIRHKSSLNFDEFVQKQSSILQSGCNLLAGGNELAYITCTLNPAENEKMIASLLAARPEMELLIEWQTANRHPWLEGMYGARLRKKI